MDCRITSTSQRRQRCAAFSLVESWVTIAVSSIVVAGICSFTLYTGKSFAGMANYVDLERLSQNAIDTMTRDVRQTQFLSSYSTNELVFMDGDWQPLSYTYHPSTRTLVRTKGGTNTVLLTECDLLSWSIFQRNPIAGIYDQYPTATATNCKLINVTWVCSRKILGHRLNTESVQTAKIVIRKQ